MPMPQPTPANNLPTVNLLRELLSIGEYPLPPQNEAGEAVLGAFLEAAYDALEEQTGQACFIPEAGAHATVRELQSVNGFVEFGASLIEIGAVKIGSRSGAYDVRDLNSGWRYTLLPANETPATYLRFDAAITNTPGSVQVWGVWGVMARATNTVRLALLNRAAALYLSERGLAPDLDGAAPDGGQIKKREDDGVSVEFEGGASAQKLAERRAFVASGRALWQEVVEKYRYR